MNEFLRKFIMDTVIKMIDSVSVPEWQVREYALGWYSKGLLTEQDLIEVEERYKQPEPTAEEVQATEVESTEETSIESVVESEENNGENV